MKSSSAGSVEDPPPVPDLPPLKGGAELVQLAERARTEILADMRDVLRWMASRWRESERPERARASIREAWHRYLDLRQEDRAWWWLERREVAPVYVLTGRGTSACRSPSLAFGNDRANEQQPG